MFWSGKICRKRKELRCGATCLWKGGLLFIIYLGRAEQDDLVGSPLWMEEDTQGRSIADLFPGLFVVSFLHDRPRAYIKADDWDTLDETARESSGAKLFPLL